LKKNAHFKFRLYVAGDGPNSLLAIANLNSLCRDHLAQRHEVEIVDVLHHPKRALVEGVMLTPMLVILSPAPVRKIVGSLSQRDAVLQTLGLSSTVL
jgi:circadian clock protein KaiB